MNRRAMTPEEHFRADVEAKAVRALQDLVGGEHGRRAAMRVAMSLQTLARRNAKILQCSPESVGYCVAMCALTGLMPGGPYPQCDVIPRRRKFKRDDGGWGEVMEANWQIGYRGALQLVQRAGHRITPITLYEGMPVNLDPNGMMILPTRPVTFDRSWENLIGVLVTIHRIEDNAYLGWEIVYRDQIEARRERSESWQQYQRVLRDQRAPDWKIERAKQTPWVQWPDEMARKTAIRYVVARGLVPVDDTLAEALAADSRSDMARPEVIDVEATTAPSGRAALGLAPDTEPDAEREMERRQQRKPVREEPAREMPVQEELHPEQEPARQAQDDDAAAMKARAFELEEGLAVGAVRAAREKVGMGVEVDVRKWRGRIGSARSYLQLLEEAKQRQATSRKPPEPEPTNDNARSRLVAAVSAAEDGLSEEGVNDVRESVGLPADADLRYTSSGMLERYLAELRTFAAL